MFPTPEIKQDNNKLCGRKGVGDEVLELLIEIIPGYWEVVILSLLYMGSKSPGHREVLILSLGF